MITMPSHVDPTGLLKNGDKLIFNTQPPTIVTIIGIFEDSYALLWSDNGTVENIEVKKLTFDEFEEARADGLISFVGEPAVSTSASADSKPSAEEASGSAVRKPPWAK